VFLPTIIKVEFFMKNLAISDAQLVDLEWKSSSLVIVNEESYLLRRFGQIELVKVEEGVRSNFLIHSRADVVMSVAYGGVIVHMLDTREASPSFENEMDIRLDDRRPQAVLIPFGVAFRYEGVRDGIIIVVKTHSDQQTTDDIKIPFSDLAGKIK
jgi:dTDP-4-dehydrorhamnose 3,5-epimerase-like enzyme